MRGHLQKVTLRLVGDLRRKVEALDLLLAFARVDKGREDEGEQRDKHVEELESDHLLEQRLVREGPRAGDRRRDGDSRRDQCRGRGAAKAEPQRGHHDQGKDHVLEPQPGLKDGQRDDANQQQQTQQLGLAAPAQNGRVCPWQEAEQERRHQQHAHRVARPPDRPGRREILRGHSARKDERRRSDGRADRHPGQRA